MSREFSTSALLPVWDFIFSGIAEQQGLTEPQPLIHLDYICAAILCSMRKLLVGQDQMNCLQLLLNLPLLDTNREAVEIAHRVKRILDQRC